MVCTKGRKDRHMVGQIESVTAWESREADGPRDGLMKITGCVGEQSGAKGREMRPLHDNDSGFITC